MNIEISGLWMERDDKALHIEWIKVSRDLVFVSISQKLKEVESSDWVAWFTPSSLQNFDRLCYLG